MEPAAERANPPACPGPGSPAPGLVVGDLLRLWQASSLHWRASTRIAAASDIRAHLMPYWGHWQLEAIRRRDIQAWVAHLDYAPRTVDTIFGRFLAFLSWCVDEELLQKNPGHKIRLPPPNPREHVFLTVAQVRALADCAGERHAPLIWLLASTGLRIGEAVELRGRDLQPELRRLRVERSVVFVNGGPAVVGPPKNGQPRSVALTAQLMGLLQPLAAPLDPDRLLFTSARGAQIRPNNFRRRSFTPAVLAVNAAARDAGPQAVRLPERLRVHDLRHTAASWMVASGASVKVVQRMLGHATAAITLDTYAGLFDHELDDVARRLDRMLTDNPDGDANRKDAR